VPKDQALNCKHINS